MIIVVENGGRKIICDCGVLMKEIVGYEVSKYECVNCGKKLFR